MKCERTQELIITDYLDDQLDNGQKRSINDHLASCPHCREFAVTARKAVVDPFSRIDKRIPPENLWSKIKEAIKADQSPIPTNAFADFLVNLKNIFLIPKPAFAFAIVSLLILVAGVATKMTMSHQGTSEQIEYLVYLAQPEGEAAVGEEKGLGTFIEQYFL
jgi:anti-sigma factor RsiW